MRPIGRLALFLETVAEPVIPCHRDWVVAVQGRVASISLRVIGSVCQPCAVSHGRLAETLLRDATNHSEFHQGIRLSEHIDGADGAIVFQHACKLGLEGIVAKRRDRPYRSGRTTSWLKVRNPNAPAVKRFLEEPNAG